MVTQLLVFLDIDGTLLDSNYVTNDLSLKEFITASQKAGLTYGLNSNRALQDLLPIAEQFDIRGPIVGENGLFVYDPVIKHTFYLLEQFELDKLKQLKHDIQKQLKLVLLALFPGKEVKWHNIDTVKAVDQPPTGFKEGTIVVLNNRYRDWTISAHLKMCRQGRLVAIPEILPTIVRELQKSSIAENIVVTYSSDFSNILMYSSLISKRSAAEYLMRHKFKQKRLIIIGDEQNDANMAKDIGDFMTTANAQKEVKSQALVVAKEPYAKGVHELLMQCMESYGT